MIERHDYPYVERRRHICLTEDQMEHLVKEVSEEVVKIVQANLKDMMYKELGKSVADQVPGMLGGAIEKLFWVLGICGTAVFVYLNSHGFLEK